MFDQNQQEIKNYKMTYDSDHDVLYLYFGEPRTSYEDETAPDIFIRISEDDDEVITGLIIIDYKKKDTKKIKKMIPINLNFDNINQLIN